MFADFTDAEPQELWIDDVLVTFTVEWVDGRPALTQLVIQGDDISSDLLRRIKPARLIANHLAGQLGTIPPLERRSNELPDDFYRRVAEAFRAASATSNKPITLLADRSGAPHSTVAFWVKEARRKGILEPTRARGRNSDQYREERNAALRKTLAQHPPSDEYDNLTPQELAALTPWEPPT